MAPKQVTPKKVVKRTPTKTPTKSGPVKESEMKKSLVFLWMCFKSGGSQVNMASVAKQLDIKPSVASVRFSRLKKKLEEMEAAENLDSSPLQPVDNPTNVIANANAKANHEAKAEAEALNGSGSDGNADADIEDGDQEDSKLDST
ncbi:unnamed protein product [Penicillium salamii]|nr:unnamed protein product [Penicillium salamii]